ncbi:MAG: GtrA family protein [Proteobacteria bacterium]|nr:GtrA family protein [Pseudomonadota bacterium]
MPAENFNKARRFVVTGLLVTALHVLVAALLIDVAHIPPSFANGIAFLTATTVSYTVNTLWSFSSALHGRSLVRFMAVSVIGGFLAMAISFIAQEASLHYLFGIALVAFMVPPVTFLLHNFWTYR